MNKINKKENGRRKKKKKKRYTPISKIKTVQQKYRTIGWSGKQRKAKIVSTRTTLTTAQTGKWN